MSVTSTIPLTRTQKQVLERMLSGCRLYVLPDSDSGKEPLAALIKPGQAPRLGSNKVSYATVAALVSKGLISLSQKTAAHDVYLADEDGFARWRASGLQLAVSPAPTKWSRALQSVYDAMLWLASDRSSELYSDKGQPRLGVPHRRAFWMGATGQDWPSDLPRKGSQRAAFAAGKEIWRRGTRLR
jgi:hypothetical protein